MQDHAVSQYYSVLIPVSRSYSQLEGRLLTCSSPLRHSDIAIGVRLACLIHAASVRSEPESNSPNKNCQADRSALVSRSQKLDLLLNSFRIFLRGMLPLNYDFRHPFGLSEIFVRAHRTIQIFKEHQRRQIPRRYRTAPKDSAIPLMKILHSADYGIRINAGSHLKRCTPLRRALT